MINSNYAPVAALVIMMGMLSAQPAGAGIILPDIISDGMVLQQRSDVKIRGKATPGSKISVTPSWNNRVSAAHVGSDSLWCVTVATPEAGGPYMIDISGSDGSKVTLNNVLSGEVWFCSGQSNMEMPMRGFDRQPLDGTNAVIARAKASTPIRIFTSDSKNGQWVRSSSKTPQTDVAGEWWLNTPDNVANSSAIAYLFARYLNDVLDVPVGIIVSTLGGSRIEPWMSREALEGFEGYTYTHLDEGTETDPWSQPCLLYNAKVAPFTDYKVNGFLWYQGESNRHNPDTYDRLMASMVNDWRRRWDGGEDNPFYFVEIAPFRYEGDDKTSAALLRESQARALQLIPGSGIASTIDVGQYNFIHPTDKFTPSERLAWLALTDTYGMTGFGSHSPRYESMEVIDGKIYVNVTDAPQGLSPMWTSLTGFEIAGADRVFHPAFAEIEEKTCRLAVSSPDVPEPVAVRYCFSNVPQPSVYNVAGLPLLPFRSDDWEVK